MFKTTITLAFRHLIKNKGPASLNIAGLGMGIALAWLIALYVREETTYDAFHVNRDRIVRTVMSTTVNGQVHRNASIHYPIANRLTSLPEVEAMTRVVQFSFYGNRPVLRVGNRSFYEDGFFFADSNLFRVFSIPLRRGSPATALTAANTVLLTPAMAEKYFGTEDCIGQTIRLNGMKDIVVTGIVEPLPRASHLQFDFLASIRTIEESGFSRSGFNFWDNWVINPYWTYVLLHQAGDQESFESKLATISRDHYPAMHRNNKTMLHVQRLLDIHTDPSYLLDITPATSKVHLTIFSLVAVLVLGMACINYMNLTTARSIVRAREIGLRKVAGAYRSQLVMQFFGEAAATVFSAMLLAWLMAASCLPVFNGLIGRPFSLSDMVSAEAVALLLGMGLLVALISGAYPAFYFSGFQPALILKGVFSRSGKGIRIRRVLVVFQFGVSIMLVIGTVTIYRQLAHIRTADLGYHREAVLIIPIRGTSVAQRYADFKTELLQQPNVRSVTHTSEKFGTGAYFTGFYVEGHDDMQFVSMIRTGHDFSTTLGLQMVEGRDFRKESPGDSTTAYLVNQAFMRHYGWQSAVGKRVRAFREGTPPGTVVGVIKDFYSGSVHNPVKPLIVMMGAPLYMTIRVQTAHMAETMEVIERLWNKWEKEKPFSFSFLDDEVGRLYRAEDTLGRAIAYACGLAIVIAMMGLLGTASFMINQRTREIGIRKVLGAENGGIVRLLAAGFTRDVWLALLVAAPAGASLMQNWLEGFSSRVDLEWWVYPLAGGGIWCVALLTILQKAIVASRIRPVKMLRYD